MAEGNFRQIFEVEERAKLMPMEAPGVYSEAPDRYLMTHQQRLHPSTVYEGLLGDAIERAFEAGHYDLPGLVADLNRQGISSPEGKEWTEDNYKAVMARYGD